MDEDVQLLLQQRRYPAALEQLLDRYEMRVFRMAVMYLKDPARAEEIKEEVFLKLWRALPHYDARASPGTWLYTIARNTCLSASRSDSYRKTIPLDSISEPAAPPAAQPGDGELARCIDRLPATQRNAITLFYLQEKRVDEVARLLRIPKPTAKIHLYRA